LFAVLLFSGAVLSTLIWKEALRRVADDVEIVMRSELDDFHPRDGLRARWALLQIPNGKILILIQIGA
jgi:hypothetical protein